MAKKIIWALLLSGAAQAGGGSVALVTTAPNFNAWQITDVRGRDYLQTRLTASRSITISVSSGSRDIGLRPPLDTIYLVAEDKDYLFPEDLRIFKQVVLNVAHDCFNLSKERDRTILAALDKMNKVPSAVGYVQLGPATMTYDRRVHAMGTSVEFFREGEPGKGTWVNYCTP